MKNEKETRGGAREGAGRPAVDAGSKRRNRGWAFSDDEVKRVGELAAEWGVSVPDAVMRAIDFAQEYRDDCGA